MDKRIMAACGPLYHRLEKKTNKSSFCWGRRRQGAKGGRIAQFFAVSKTSHRDVFDGQPVRPLAPARRAFQLQTAAAVCHQKTRRPSSRVPPSVQGGGLPSFFLYRKKKEAKPLRAKSRRYAAVALRDAAAAAERLPPEKCFARSRPKSQP